MADAQQRAAALHREMAALFQEGPASRRRAELIAWAVADGRLERDAAAEVYELAAEESLEPAYGLALARAGFWVRELVPPEPAEETTEQDAPQWIAPRPDARTTARERQVRASLRRLRALLERHGTPAAAVDAYLSEPDVDGPAD